MTAQNSSSGKRWDKGNGPTGRLHNVLKSEQTEKLRVFMRNNMELLKTHNNIDVAVMAARHLELPITDNNVAKMRKELRAPKCQRRRQLTALTSPLPTIRTGDALPTLVLVHSVQMSLPTGPASEATEPPSALAQSAPAPAPVLVSIAGFPALPASLSDLPTARALNARTAMRSGVRGYVQAFDAHEQALKAVLRVIHELAPFIDMARRLRDEAQKQFEQQQKQQQQASGGQA